MPDGSFGYGYASGIYKGMVSTMFSLFCPAIDEFAIGTAAANNAREYGRH
jgi:hypothetical protein